MAVKRFGVSLEEELLNDGWEVVKQEFLSSSPNAESIEDTNEYLIRYKYIKNPQAPGADIKEKLEELRLIKGFIDAAKAKVEYCHEPQAGMELLIYAQKRLNKYATECAC